MSFRQQIRLASHLVVGLIVHNGHKLWRIMGLIFSAAVLSSGLSVSAQAQDKIYTVGWAEIVPLFAADENGNASGFGSEVIREIAARADIQIEFKKFDRPEAMIRAQARGELDILPAIAALPFLEENNVFSRPIAETHMRVFVRAEDENVLNLDTMRGKKIAIPSVPVGPIGEELLLRNIATEIPVGTHSLTELLRGSVDALIASDSVTISDARQLRVDHRILSIGSVNRFDRVITISKDLVGKLDRINEAIAQLDAEGWLAEKRARWLITIPPPAPDILTVGVYHLPPYNIVGPNGVFSGYAVETLRNLAERAHLDVRFVEISRDEWIRGPAAGSFDLMPQVVVSYEKAERMDFTFPVEQTGISLFVRRRDVDSISGIDDLDGKTIGILSGTAAEYFVKDRDPALVKRADDRDILWVDLVEGRIDALIGATRSGNKQIREKELVSQLIAVEPPLRMSRVAPAVRLGLGEVRERLNAVIPSYLITDEHQYLIADFYRDGVFWTQDRIRAALIYAGAILLATIGFMTLLFIWRYRHNAQERRRSAAELAENVPMGMMLLSREGDIVFLNANYRNLKTIGRDELAEGKSYRDCIQSIYDRGCFVHAGAKSNEFLKELKDGIFIDGHEMEFTLHSGSTFIRYIKHLSNGLILLFRIDISHERQRNEEIRALNTQLDHQFRIAQAANEELRAFAYATSHDLKAPTNTMKLLIDAFEEDIESLEKDDVANYLGRLKRTASRMSRLIDDVLEYTSTIGDEQSERELVDLNTILGEVVENLGDEITKSGAQINVGTLPTVRAHPWQMRLLFQNLLANALKFKSPDRTAVIKVESAGESCSMDEIIVADNGIGIKADNINKIFMLFKRLNRRDQYAGTGLGLPICQRVAQNHGGRIEVSSIYGKGSEFKVFFGKTPE